MKFTIYSYDSCTKHICKMRALPLLSWLGTLYDLIVDVSLLGHKATD